MEEKQLNRKFGFMLSILFILLASYLFKKANSLVFCLLLGLASLFFAYVALFAPNILSPFTKAWMHLGMLLNKIVSPIILGIVFFGVITPMAVLFKLLGKDLLKLKWNNQSTTYWIKRDLPGPLPQEMENPF